jgi:alkylation response protein AidB-like acyl-CoA dehydrogenase
VNKLARTDLLARVATLASDVADAADQIEATRRIPESLVAKLHEARLFRMLLPQCFDGDEVDPSSYLLALEALAIEDASLAWNIFVGNSSALIAPFIDAETVRSIYQDPRAVISWGPPNASKASAVAGGYRVSGQWDFASGCRQASWMGAHCQVLETDGSLRLNSAGRVTMRTLLFPVEQATLLDTWNTIGLRGTASDSYQVDDLFVAEACSGTREDPTLRGVAGPLYAFPMQGIYAVGVAGVALGIARAMLTLFSRLAQNKTPRGLTRLADASAVQAGVAHAEATIGAAKAYLLQTLAEVYARADDMQVIAVPDRARVRLAATHAIHGAIEVTDYVYKAAGVNAIFPGSPFERRFRDIHTLSQQIQARDAHYEAVGQVMLRVPPEIFF